MNTMRRIRSKSKILCESIYGERGGNVEKKKENNSISADTAIHVFLVLFIYYPAVKTLFKSLFLINSSNMPVKFVGMGNYRKLFSDETFLKSIVVTFEYALVVIPVTILMGYLLALISASGRRLSPVYELMYAMPMAVSMSVASVIFKLLLMGIWDLSIMCFT